MNSLELPPLTLPQMLREQACRQPARVAIRQKEYGLWNPLTWQAYYCRSCHFGIGLRILGLTEGSHLAILSENRLEWVLAQMGAGLIGAITVGVYPTSPTPEVAYVLGHADVEIVVCEDQEQTDKVLAALDELPRLRRIIVVETKGLLGYGDSLQRIATFADVERLGLQHEVTQHHLVMQTLERQSLDDIGLIIYTSGSTGKPKGAMISYRNIRGVTPGMIERLELSENTVHLSYLPLCHVAEQMLTTFVPIYLGSQVNFGESVRTVQEDLREVAPTVFLGVPRIWEKLYSSIYVKLRETGKLRRWLVEQALALCEPFCELDRDQRSPVQALTYRLCYWLVLRALLNYVGLRRAQIAMTGAAPISPAIVRFFRTVGVPLVEVYGLTESTGMIFGQRRTAICIGTVGEPILGVEHRIAAQGELQIRGNMVFVGYYKNPQATAATIRDGWLYTGDVVTEKNTRLKIVDRMKDIMITDGGKNLSPSEIENTLKASPYIKECIILADRRRYVAALVQLDFQTVGKWAEERQILFTHYRSLAESEQVRELIGAEIECGNAQLASVEQVKRFHLLTKELDHDDGEVTATMKVRRAHIYRMYANEIEALYGGDV